MLVLVIGGLVITWIAGIIIGEMGATSDLGLLPADFDLSNAEDQFLVKYDLTKIE